MTFKATVSNAAWEILYFSPSLIALAVIGVLFGAMLADPAPPSRGEAVGESETQHELAFQTYLGLLAPETLDLYTETGQSPLVMCVEAAIQTCGEGEVCGVCVYQESCSFQCRNTDGSCPPSPHCGPSPDITPDYTSDPSRHTR